MSKLPPAPEFYVGHLVECFEDTEGTESDNGDVIVGGIYRVSVLEPVYEVGQVTQFWGVDFVGMNNAPDSYYDAKHFRKVLPADSDFVRKMRAFRPADTRPRVREDS